uniref:tyrosine--tRNA ligase n=1 Tax=Chromera velia CCMP2878 TaxID=1169474 RepID=A0A0G4G1W6_9ALVE|eukprot:Cvel_4070.t1-p1 / transcript=Cvel_4070.t1 / gene=Cvel_4070 / organism=Chromera_velia_CCMP2878 / gene_product=Tyrosine--tRNA ligase, putative / transcript_product=Tyrosine--tRNA ligase, putative / location=Cvel_scaffold173:82144-87369(-) / protein_length=456 / sequence_SO=supercontig / SO=protein_coding / is_pseudo=false
MIDPFSGGLGAWKASETGEAAGPPAPPVVEAKGSSKGSKEGEPSSSSSGSKKDKQKGEKGQEKVEVPAAAAASSSSSSAPVASGEPYKPGEVVVGRGRPWPDPVVSELSLDERYQVCLSVGCECVTEENLKALLEKKPHPICYDGFEPSGRMHIAQGVLKAINVNKLTSAGCVFIFWVADWFALLNNKMGGDIAKIQKVGEYFIEVWKAAGMDMRNVRFLWASEEINRDPNGYWMRVMDIATKFNISRVKRCGAIMGRGEGDDQPSAQILYPCMQCADIFFLKADICQLGLDQRKVNMLAREYCDVSKMKFKPVILSHGMMPGLLEGQEKMSKSDPDSAIFMEDSEVDVNRKIKKAYCPPQKIEGNPCIHYAEALVFPRFGKFEVERKESDGGNIAFETPEAFKEAFTNGSLHPGDLKAALTKYINRLIEPVRKHFKEDPKAKALLDTIKKYKVTK